MAKDTPSKKYKGVYYRDLKSGDRSYFLIIRIDGKQKRIHVGKKSEGITEAFCYQQKISIINAERFGEEQAQILQRTKKQSPTFYDITQHYLKHGSARDSSKRLMHYLANMVPFKDQSRVTERDVTEWLSEYKKSVKLGTINNKINLLNVLFQHGIDQDLYRFANPMRNVKKYKIDDKRLRYLSKAEVKQLLEAVKDKPNLYLFCKLALNTGARLSTLVRIHKNDINGDQIKLYNVKTARYYKAFIDQETQRLLNDRTGYVLAWRDDNQPPDVNEYQWRLRRIFDPLFNDGVKDSMDRVVIHTLRHTTASLLVQNGTPLHVVQKILDHQSIRSTERYAKLHEENIKTELHKLWD